MERGKQIGDSFGNQNCRYDKLCNGYDHRIMDRIEGYKEKIPSISCTTELFAIASPSSSSPPSASSSPGAGFIEHRVSKFDTLAGVAIMYGVEVADIKKMNNLVTDLQMFGLKTLQIPLPGRHPPSPCLSSGFVNPNSQRVSEHTSPSCMQNGLFDSFQSLKLKSTNSVRGYYGPKATDHEEASSNGFPMQLHNKGFFHQENGHSNLASRNSVKANERSLRRKSEGNFHSRANCGGFSGITAKGLALRSKSGSRTNLAAADSETCPVNPMPTDSHEADSSYAVRKSLSTSNLREQNNNQASSSLWSTSRWNLKSDLQVLSAAATTCRPILDGLTARKPKAALD